MRLAAAQLPALLVAGAMLCSATACNYSKVGVDPDTKSSTIETTSSDIEGAWLLVSGSGPEGEIGIVEHNPVTFVVDPDGNAGGRAGCNWYGNARWKEGKGLQGDVVQTLMGCRRDIQASEGAFLAAIGDARHAVRTGDRLVLTGPTTELILTLQEPVSTAGLLDRTWVLEQVIDKAGISSASVGDDPFLWLASNGSFKGSTGCSDLKGTYFAGIGYELEVTGMEIEMRKDQMKCPSELAVQHGVVMDAVGGSFRPDVDGDRLTVSSMWTDAVAIYRAEAP